MKGLQTELKDLLTQEAQSKSDLQNVFKTLGYEL
jgi:type I restriction enzyme M protein